LPERYLGRSLGRFRVDALIGSGGFAWVYKGFDPELEIPVALKVLKPQYAGDEKFEARFRREASTAAKLRHPNIIKIFAVGREEEAVFFAMDYLPQGLADRLNVMTTLPEAMLIRMAIDVGSALGFAHREGVIHRDIKTDNILFDEHGNAIVADFGIARAVSGYAEQTGTNMVVGTPQYFAPEQARGLPLDGRADIYSLGITLFKSSTGQLPFNGTDWYEIARQHVEDKPPKPRTINPALSRELEDVILKCLEKDPGDRFPTGDVVCEVLMRLMAERGETMALRTGYTQTADTISAPLALPRGGIGRRGSAVRRRSFMAAGGIGVAALASLLWWGTSDTRAVQPSPAQRTPPVEPFPSSTDDEPATTNPPQPRVLAVDATPGATVLVNGVEVGKGPWSTDTLPAGSYTVTASVKTIDNCPSASVSKSMALREQGTDSVSLLPRPCGQLEIDAQPKDAAYSIVSLIYKTVDGVLPLKAPLVLPAGNYTLKVQASYCAESRQQFKIAPEKQNRVRVRLICDRR
jgi:serine/threonine protein kinase